MATQAIQGRRGRVTLAYSSGSTAQRMAEVTDYTLTVEMPEADASSFDSSGWNEHLPIDRSWELQFSVVATSANWNGSASQAAAWSHFYRDSNGVGRRWVTLFPSTSVTASWKGWAVASLTELHGDLENVMQADFTFQGHAALTYTT